ncbi:glycosyltransferase family 2 protein [Neptunicella sp. SCSIO 80796]|uniref:glycosyltransferase family 2 protein n=1 Tax=Neptunicella plasticusilytica TaxID=3117012 RepID=UPI003A4D766F
MNCCAVVPTYNHHQQLSAVCQQLIAFNLAVILIDDGSNDETAQVIDELARTADISLIRHNHNLGKGAAVINGFKMALQSGFTHALQVDADGQHNLADIPALLDLAKRHPDKIVSGLPVYDDSIPIGRKYGRYITHFWVWIETLSLSVKDTMCGFRIYPLKPCIALTEQYNIGARMDFDIEIMVRLYWRGVESIFLPTRVIYPQQGLSHFQPLQDNLRISWLHTRLFFGMLMRLPILLSRKFKQ